MAKTVCIIGAGPSGLVAAKTLTHEHPGTFHVTVFSNHDRIGGLWPTSKDDNTTDKWTINPDMCTNQSRHTVSFSDLAWEENASSFPKAWEVGRYLERYIEMYPGYDIQLGTQVINARLEDAKWRVTVAKMNEVEKEVLWFDHVITATGFFGCPKWPKLDQNDSDEWYVPVGHSTRIRKVVDFLHWRDDRREKKMVDGEKQKPPHGRNIVVVGGQMSGVEVAASMAFQLSSLANSSGPSPLPDADQYSVYHVIQKPVWVMPLFFPSNPDIPQSDSNTPSLKQKNKSPTFLPLDLVNYNLSGRPPGPIQNTSGHVSIEQANMVHGFMESYIGSNQSDLGSLDLSMTAERTRSEPPLLACSDSYTEFVRAGKIKIIRGRLQSISSGDPAEIVISLASSHTTTLPDVAAIILATGFEYNPSLDFLSDSVKSTLQYVEEDHDFPLNDSTLPLALNVHSTVNAKIPSLGFVGFYRSPYWGVMEMQARFLGKLWSGDEKCKAALEEDKTLEKMLMLRDDERIAQFPMGDYAYLMESFSEILGIQRVEPAQPKALGDRTGIVLPARYLYPTSNETEKSESQKELQIIDRIFDGSQNTGKFVARAVFRALQGIWKLERKIESVLDSFPSGILNGKAKFLPREPTGEDTDMEYLYFEEGDFKPSWGGTMSAKRSYVYHYLEAKDKINVWFAKPDYKTSDYFFHELEFIIPGKDDVEGNSGWKAQASHLCIQDLYNVTYEFNFGGTMIESWTSRYIVKGPKKNYTIENLYRR